jgi:hypothetical protein
MYDTWKKGQKSSFERHHRAHNRADIVEPANVWKRYGKPHRIENSRAGFAINFQIMVSISFPYGLFHDLLLKMLFSLSRFGQFEMQKRSDSDIDTSTEKETFAALHFAHKLNNLNFNFYSSNKSFSQTFFLWFLPFFFSVFIVFFFTLSFSNFNLKLYRAFSSLFLDRSLSPSLFGLIFELVICSSRAHTNQQRRILFYCFFCVFVLCLAIFHRPCFEENALISPFEYGFF